MLEHEQRVVDEAEDLASKVSKLGAFIGTETFDKLQDKERNLLTVQLGLMKNYHLVLTKRIGLFSA